MTRWRIWLAAMAVLGGALLVACGGGDDKKKDDGGGDEPTATASATGDETPAAGDGGGNGDGASPDLTELAGQWATKQAKIVYDITSSDGSFGGTYTVYWNPPDEWRLDATSEGSTATFIKTGGSTYVCSADGSGGGQCLDSPGLTIPVPFLGAFFDAGQYENFVEGSFAGVNADTSEETIAGMGANCYTVSSNVTGAEGEFEFCASDDGLPLRVRVGAAGVDYAFEATSAEGSVADADFELPYEVLEIPTG